MEFDPARWGIKAADVAVTVLLKIGGLQLGFTHRETASRIRIALASCCPEAETFSLVALGLQPSAP